MDTKKVELEKVEAREISKLYAEKSEKHENKYNKHMDLFKKTNHERDAHKADIEKNLFEVYAKMSNKFNKIHNTF